MTAKELGERLNLGTGTLTPMISRMIANGWLRKERSKADERKVYIFLEEKAHNEKQDITKSVGEAIQTCSIELEEYEELMKLLGNLRVKLRSRVPR